MKEQESCLIHKWVGRHLRSYEWRLGMSIALGFGCELVVFILTAWVAWMAVAYNCSRMDAEIWLQSPDVA